MEPVTLLMVAAGFAASCVAQKCADKLIDSAWSKIKSRFQESLGRDPEPLDVATATSFPEVLTTDNEFLRAASDVVGSSSCLRRAQIAAAALKGARILWIDDCPQNNAWERAVLGAFGAQITPVKTTKSALAYLGRELFDAIISDAEREGSRREGIAAIPAIFAKSSETPIVFYVAKVEPDLGTPGGSFGITNRPDELLHLLLDALERTRL